MQNVSDIEGYNDEEQKMRTRSSLKTVSMCSQRLVEESTEDEQGMEECCSHRSLISTSAGPQKPNPGLFKAMLLQDCCSYCSAMFSLSPVAKPYLM